MKYSLWVLPTENEVAFALYDNEKHNRNACGRDITYCLSLDKNPIIPVYNLRSNQSILYPIEEISHAYILSTYPELFI